MQIITIHGKPYVIGLDWLMLPGEGRVYKRVDAMIAGWDARPAFCVARKSAGNDQVGFTEAGGETGEVAMPRGARSLACALASVVPATWFGAFALADDKAWVVRIVDGFIDPYGDRVVPIEEARKQTRELSRGGSETIVAALDDPESALEKLIELAPDAGTAPRLKVVPKDSFGAREKKKIMFIGGGAMGVIALIVGWNIYSSHMYESQQKKLQAQQQADHLRAEKERRERASEVPWLGWPIPETVVSSCFHYIAGLPVMASGWKLKGVGCGFYVSGSTAQDQLSAAPKPADKLQVLLLWSRIGGFGLNALPSVSGHLPVFHPSRPDSLSNQTTIGYPHIESELRSGLPVNLAGAPLFFFATNRGLGLKVGSWRQVPSKDWSWMAFSLGFSGTNFQVVEEAMRRLEKEAPGAFVRGVSWEAPNTINIYGVLYATGQPLSDKH